MHSMETLVPPVDSSVIPPRQRKLRIFLFGLGVRLVGLLLIWLGDGSSSIFRKSVVVLGVILSVGGIGVLKYLLNSGLHKKRRTLDL
jgi:hypothetical protein